MNKVLVYHQSNYQTDTKKLKVEVKKLLETHGVKDGVVSIALVGERKAKELAKTYLGDQNVHNVLSFPYLEGKNKDFPIPEGKLQLGDIVICYPQARREASQKNKLVDQVIMELAKHGTLHLLGIHHE